MIAFVPVFRAFAFLKQRIVGKGLIEIFVIVVAGGVADVVWIPLVRSLVIPLAVVPRVLSGCV